MGWNLELKVVAEVLTNQGNSDVDNDTMATVITITNQNLVQVLTIALEAKGMGTQHKSIQSRHINQYWPGCKFQENNVGQSIWYKVRCYWERVKEDIGNMVNMFGSHWEFEGTHWEQKKPKKFQHPHTLPKRKK